MNFCLPLMIFQMKVILYVLLTCSAFLSIESCNQKPKIISPADKITYERDIKPLLAVSCNPCHFDNGISPYKFENYEAVKYKIEIILSRVNKEQGAKKFMPKDGTKLSPEAIAILRKWHSRQVKVCKYIKFSNLIVQILSFENVLK